MFVLKTYTDGTEENITETAIAGEYDNLFTGLCCAPEERHKRSTSQGDVFSTRYDIAISNNGENYGPSETLHVFDSTCQDALPDADNGHQIVLKVGSHLHVYTYDIKSYFVIVHHLPQASNK